MRPYRLCLVLTLSAALLFAPAAPAVDLVVGTVSLSSASSSPETGTAGATVVAGDAIYIDPADSLVKPADANLSANGAAAVGVALSGASSGAVVVFVRNGDVNLGVTLTMGETYVLSRNAGKICPIADFTTADRLTYLGYATSTTVLRLNVRATGVVKP